MGSESRDEQTGAQACLHAYHMHNHLLKLAENTPPPLRHLSHTGHIRRGRRSAAFPRLARRASGRRCPPFGLLPMQLHAIVACCWGRVQPKRLSRLPVLAIYGNRRMPACRPHRRRRPCQGRGFALPRHVFALPFQGSNPCHGSEHQLQNLTCTTCVPRLSAAGMPPPPSLAQLR